MLLQKNCTLTTYCMYCCCGIKTCYTLFPLNCIPLKSSLFMYIATPSGTPGGCQRCTGVGNMPKAYRCLGACKAWVWPQVSSVYRHTQCKQVTSASAIPRFRSAYVIRKHIGPFRQCVVFELQHLPWSCLLRSCGMCVSCHRAVLTRTPLVHPPAKLCVPCQTHRSVGCAFQVRKKTVPARQSGR